MTEPELAELVRDCPLLFHMAERGAWPSIAAHGLLSASALLDLVGLAGPAREALEAARRPDIVRLAPGIALRDQKTMNDAALRRCLDDGLAPADWYRLLNARVFFWLSRARLARLLAARPYRDRAHDVLVFDTASLVAAHRHRITLSPINSGATSRYPVRRGRCTLATIADYDYASWRARRPRGERVVELAVEEGVRDVGRFVRGVFAMAAGAEPVALPGPAAGSRPSPTG